MATPLVLWHTVAMAPSEPHINPFLKLSFIEFFAVQTLTIAFFPISLVVCFLAYGPQTTRDLAEALIRDWVQTLLIALTLMVLLVSGLIWGVLAWLA